MNYARRWNRRAASRNARRLAVKDQIRRGLLAERLEDRSLMAADLGSFLASSHSAYWNANQPNDVNADVVGQRPAVPAGTPARGDHDGGMP